jgi:hypothetical protein
VQLLLCLLLFAASAGLGAEQPPPDLKTVRQSFRSFHADPESVHGEKAEIIFRYAEQSPDVQLVLNRTVVALLSNQKQNFGERSTLLMAFIVGNVEAQWAHHETKDNSYAGVVQVIATYRQLQKHNPKLRIPEVEKLIELEKHGELERYVASA